MIRIRTRLQPTEEIEVDDAEAEVLRLNGLLYEPPTAPVIESDPGPEITVVPTGSAVAPPAPKPSPVALPVENDDAPAGDAEPDQQASAQEG